jgi:hypothetical protein
MTRSAARRWARRTALPAGVALIALVAMTHCGESNGPTAPTGSAIALTGASVIVNGHIVNEQALPRGHGQSGSTRFEASLMFGSRPAPGEVVQVRFDRPGLGMMHRTGMFSLYDDGTHGDPVPGDGIYCYEDMAGQYGCHTEDARPGQYHYDFSGMHQDMHESNHIMVTVTINP